MLTDVLKIKIWNSLYISYSYTILAKRDHEWSIEETRKHIGM